MATTAASRRYYERLTNSETSFLPSGRNWPPRARSVIMTAPSRYHDGPVPRERGQPTSVAGPGVPRHPELHVATS